MGEESSSSIKVHGHWSCHAEWWTTCTYWLASIVLYERRSNSLNMLFIRTHISSSIRVLIPDCTNVKKLLKAIYDQFESSDKALASTLMTKLSSMKLTIVRGVREHTMLMRDITAQMMSLEVEMSESTLYTLYWFLFNNSMDLLKSLTPQIRKIAN